MEFLRELLEELHIAPPVILVNIIGFLILLALMRRFFFGPISQFLAARRQEVAEAINGTEMDRRQAKEELTSIRGRQDQMLAKAQQEASQVRQQGQQQADQLVNEAQEQALKRQQQAEKHIREQQAQALAEARGELGALSVAFAQHALRESLKGEYQQELLEAAIKDVEQVAQREGR